MLVSDLISRLEKCNQDSIVTLVGLDGGWSNIGTFVETNSGVELYESDHPENYRDKD